jgi:transposase
MARRAIHEADGATTGGTEDAIEEAYEGWQRGRLTKEEAALLLGVSDSTFRRYLVRYEEKGMEGLVDQRLGQVSHRCAPVDEVIAAADLYSRRHRGFTVKHFYSLFCG